MKYCLGKIDSPEEISSQFPLYMYTDDMIEWMKKEANKFSTDLVATVNTAHRGKYQILDQDSYIISPTKKINYF